jgi:DNA polymerase-3 subunit alpha
MAAVKNVGRGCVDGIVEERKKNGAFKDIFDLTERVDSRLMSRRALESLIAAGVCDSLCDNRAKMVQALPLAIEAGHRTQRDKSVGQESLFGGGPAEVSLRPEVPDVEEWPRAKRIAKEKEALGFYLSDHPLAPYRPIMEKAGVKSTAEIRDLPDSTRTSLIGIISSIRTTTDKNGKHMAFVVVEDFFGIVECIVFSSAYEKWRDLLNVDQVVFIEGNTSAREDEEAKILVQEIKHVEGELGVGRKLHLRLSEGFLGTPELERLKQLLRRHPGPSGVYFRVEVGSGPPATVKGGNVTVSITTQLLESLYSLLGKGRVLVEEGAAEARLENQV